MFPDISGTYSNFDWGSLFQSLARVGQQVAQGFSGNPATVSPNQYPYAAYAGYYPGSNPWYPVDPYRIARGNGIPAGGGNFSPVLFDTYNTGTGAGSGSNILLVGLLVIAVIVIAKVL